MVDPRGRRLMWWGMALFLLGLLTGFVHDFLINPRMGLAAHLEGLLNGVLLLAVGAIWPHVRVGSRARRVIYCFAIYGAAANWATTLFAAFAGTRSLTPLAGAGHGGSRWQELAVAIGFASVAVAMLTMSGLALWGLRDNAPARQGPL